MVNKKYRVEYVRRECIGAGLCEAVNPEKFKLVEGIAELKNAMQKENNEIQIVEITAEELPAMMEAAQGCPVNVIHIYEISTGKKLI